MGCMLEATVLTLVKRRKLSNNSSSTEATWKQMDLCTDYRRYILMKVRASHPRATLSPKLYLFAECEGMHFNSPNNATTSKAGITKTMLGNECWNGSVFPLNSTIFD